MRAKCTASRRQDAEQQKRPAMLDSKLSPTAEQTVTARRVADGEVEFGSGDGSLRSTLRRLGGQAHQLRAATRAADHFIGCGREEDRNTGSWLIACALDIATDLAGELDAIGRSQRAAVNDDTPAQQVQALRKRAHQLQAATRAADHFLDQDHLADRETGSWLIACAMGLAGKLASDLDDGVSPMGTPAAQPVIDHHDSAMLRRVDATVGPRRSSA